MKRSILTLLLSSLLWVACDRDDTPHEFVDNRLIEIIDDGNTHTWMRLANATGRPMCIVYLRPGDDIPEICPCRGTRSSATSQPKKKRLRRRPLPASKYFTTRK